MQPLWQDLPVTDTLLRLAAATLMGAALGVNREIRGKPAGMRTHALVSLGTALATLIAIAMATGPDGIDRSAVSRVIQGVLAGIGFLGAGAILKADSGEKVQGLTTAASVWVVAGLGVACGAGLWTLALTALVLTLLVLILGEPIERALHRLLGTDNPNGR
ncbi:MAG TPA: MgtC/SapB family protein [Longimicrobium sp.]|nr:MgtC/SapB family protein [Longimicrobium sp.]